MAAQDLPELELELAGGTVPEDGPGRRGADFDWKAFAELHAAFTNVVRESEKRLADRIDATGAGQTELEKRLREAEASIVQVKTLGALVVTLVGVVSVGFSIAAFFRGGP